MVSIIIKVKVNTFDESAIWRCDYHVQSVSSRNDISQEVMNAANVTYLRF